LTNLPPEATEQALADIATLFTGDFPALFSWTLSDEDLQSIGQPALTVLGTDSEVLFQEGIETLEANLAHAESYPLVGASHFLQMEKPVEMSGALGEFLGRHRIGS
jgi:pimeloyl-ACP methyl ester carboxylesterase